MTWYELAVKDGNGGGATEIGYMYEYGRGGPATAKKPFSGIFRLQKQAIRMAKFVQPMLVRKRRQALLKILSKPFTGTKERLSKGKSGVHMSWERMYYNGWGVPIDNAQALSLFRLGASMGGPRSADLAGDIYYFGNGVPIDYGLAKKYYQQAAWQGDTNALVNLGYMYETG